MVSVRRFRAKAEEPRVILHRVTYDSVRELLVVCDAPEHDRNDLLRRMPNDATDEPAVTRREAVEDASAGRPPRW
jgi:hypothetical protein